jgi:hypothetical protein
MSAKGTFVNEGQQGVEYTVLNNLVKKNPISLSLNFAGQLKYKINKSTNLLITPLFSIGTFNWYNREYVYEFRKDNEIIEKGVNNMKNNGSRIQMLFGIEFDL